MTKEQAKFVKAAITESNFTYRALAREYDNNWNITRLIAENGLQQTGFLLTVEAEEVLKCKFNTE